MNKPNSVRNTAMNLLARREHAAQELKQKLKQRGFEDGEIEDAITGLQLDRLQSDERFAESFVHQRVSSGRGPLKIRYELRQKGVDESLIEQVMAAHEDDWHTLMVEQRIRKFGSDLPQDYAQKMKQARFLQNRGFSPESVMRLFR